MCDDACVLTAVVSSICAQYFHFTSISPMPSIIVINNIHCIINFPFVASVVTVRLKDDDKHLPNYDFVDFESAVCISMISTMIKFWTLILN